MICHRLLAAGIIREQARRDGQLLGDEGDQLFGQVRDAVQKLRQRRAGVPDHRQLQGDAETVLLSPPSLDDVEVRALQGIQARELVPVSGNSQQLLPLRVT